MKNIEFIETLTYGNFIYFICLWIVSVVGTMLGYKHTLYYFYAEDFIIIEIIIGFLFINSLVCYLYLQEK